MFIILSLRRLFNGWPTLELNLFLLFGPRRKIGKSDQVWGYGVHDGPSRGPSTQPRFGRFLVIRILV